ncbi:MAG: hypothetical protein RBR82_07630 [Pseudomonas sp.]|nr:hypothetical protein [Pseudomonas sp.]
MLLLSRRLNWRHMQKKGIVFLIGSAMGVAAMIPAATYAAEAYALHANYLETTEEGLYEIQVNTSHNVVMTAVIDRLNGENDIGYVYGFDRETLEQKWREVMPHQAFSLAQDLKKNKLFVSHGKNKSLNISRIDIATGKLEKTGERLKVQDPSFEGNEGLRHMVFVPEANALFVGYSSTSSEATGKKNSQRLVVVDPDTLQVIDEVVGAYPSTGYALSYDAKQKMLYTAGSFINEIDPLKRKVVRSLALDKLDPAPQNILALSVDAENKRIFAAHNVFRSEGENDGVYILDLETGNQIDFVRSGRGSISVAYNPALNEAYVANFRAGNLSVIDGETYEVTRSFNVGPLPNEMMLDTQNQNLYVGLKEVYSSRSSTGDFIAGAKERILKVALPSVESQTD